MKSGHLQTGRVYMLDRLRSGVLPRLIAVRDQLIVKPLDNELFSLSRLQVRSETHRCRVHNRAFQADSLCVLNYFPGNQARRSRGFLSRQKHDVF